MDRRETEFAIPDESYTPPRPDGQADDIEEAAAELRDTVADTVRKAKDRLGEAYQRGSEAVGRTYDRAMDYSRENPSRATLIALGAGFGLGLVVAYGGSRRRAQGMFPALAAAVADTVLNVFDRR